MTYFRMVVLLTAVVLLVACGQATPAPVSEQPTENPTALPEPTRAPADEIEATGVAATEAPTVDPTGVPLPTELPESAITPIEVTYFTPAQQEGPYYTVEKPSDRDNDLVTLAGATDAPAGERVVFGGTIYDANGWPVDGAVIEIWQTDANGIYLHPNDPNTARRDTNFQFYGEAVTGENGRYAFRTILPGEYEPRPRHIHVKVKLDGQELLTTQFYFQGETALQGDGAELLIALEASEDADGSPVWVGERDVVLSVPLVKS